ncbi:hypothetical protein BV898_16967 [Hypsibius exemplaris]|uniref:CN hydrolase domain-containing protein n=1 Tax=Hypsibius exemplaris TaxID=2072580 RepID=A0A9X6NE82_HYPEX|nr:hypothetical protein BV898_16967 [Hypsibius exemplaris]
MKTAFVQWPENLHPISPEWSAIEKQVAASEGLQLLVTSELPFGPWIASNATFDPVTAQQSVDVHEAGIKALKNLKLPLVISSRPVWAADGRLANEAFALDNGVYVSLHQKHYFPEEPRFHEQTWFGTAKPGFNLTTLCGGRLKVGVLLCTDVMFTERARLYGRDGADLIVVPRASSVNSVETFFVAGRMAAISSGCYVVSSNKVGKVGESPNFCGFGYAIAPDGSVMGPMTDTDSPLKVVELDFEAVRRQQKEYPCYVHEL